MKVNRELGVIESVSVITVGEAKGHGMWIDEKALQMLVVLANSFENGVKVKADHHSGVANIIGFLQNFTLVSGKVIADLQLFKSHSDFEFYLDLAEQIPDTFGLSIAFSGGVETIGDKDYIRPTELYSIDLVTEPAANPNGLLSAFKVGSNVVKFSKLEAKQDSKPTVDEPAKVEEVDKIEPDMNEAQPNEEIKAELASLKASLAEVTQALQAQRNNSAEIAQQILASIGQPPVALAKQGNDESPELIVQHFQKLHGAEKTAYFRQHEKTIKNFASLKGK